jgi:hypothetical protein
MTKTWMAARVAAEIAETPGVEVKTEGGGFGEFSVTVDGEKIVDTNRFWYPDLRKVVEQVRARLARGLQTEA